MIAAHELIERITAAAKYKDCIVIVEEKSQANLRWANSTLTTNGVISERSVTVIAFVDLPDGVASGVLTRSDVSDHEIESVVALAGATASSAGKASDAVELQKNCEIGSWSSGHQSTNPSVFAQIAPALGEMFERSVSDSIELFGYAEHTHVTTWLGSKGGLRLRWDQPVGRIEMTGKSHQRSRSTWEGVATRDFSNVSVDDIDATIRKRLAWQATKMEIPAGRYDTIMPAGSVSDILTYMLWSAAARDAFEGRSVFSGRDGAKTRVGEILSNQKVNLYSDSTYKGLESIPFISAKASSPMSSVFDNGHKLNKTNWMTEGKLTSLVQTQSSAFDTNLAYSPIGDNYIMEVPGATGSLDDLIARTQDGLLLTTLWYIRLVDPRSLLLTGLTRDGVYRIKDGEIQGAVNNFRWNESPVELLSRIKDVGETNVTQPREWAGDIDRVAVPPIVFENFNMSTVSQAN
jgi:predicted Zn-dependent protease